MSVEDHSNGAVAANREFTVYPSSVGQRGLWYLDRIVGSGCAYNVLGSVPFESSADDAAWTAAFSTLAAHHLCMLARFGGDGREIRCAGNGADLLHIEDARAWDEQRLHHYRDVLAHHPFDLENGPLFRAVLLRTAPGAQLLFIVAHHAILDYWSLIILLRDLRRALRGQPLDRSQVSDYGGFVRWQQEYLIGREGHQGIEYWSRRLSPRPASLDLATDTREPSRITFEGAILEKEMDPRFVDRLAALASHHKCTPFVVLLSALGAALFRVSGQMNFAIGVPFLGRPRREFRETFGYFTNTLPILFQAEPTRSFHEAIYAMDREMRAVDRHQDVPFPIIVEKVGAGAGAFPIFQVMFNFLRASALRLAFPEATGDARKMASDVLARTLEIRQRVSQLELEFLAVRLERTYLFQLRYNSNRFTHSYAEMIFTAFMTILAQGMVDPSKPISQLPIMPKGARAEVLLNSRGDVRRLAPDDDYLLQYERQVHRHPERVVVSDASRRMTFAEVSRTAARVADHLRRVRLGPEEIVAVHANRCVDILPAFLGILQAGGAYLPIDKAIPDARVEELLRMSRTRAVIMDSITPPAWSATSSLPEHERWISLELGSETARSADRAADDGVATRLAYVIYTSGTTGTPKGAMIEHGGMLNHLYAKIDVLNLTAGDVVAQTAPLSFDISIWQYLASPLVGGRVHVCNEETIRDPSLLVAEIMREGITVLELTPSVIRILAPSLSADERLRLRRSRLRWLISTGEPLTSTVAASWFESVPDIPILNAYGPTECSDDITHHVLRIPPDMPRAPVGRPIPGMAVYVLDAGLAPVPVGVIGSVWAAGIGVGRGYLGDPERTASSFRPNPFTPGGRIYQTGDLGCWLADGNLDVVGREDSQVKIKGIRVEPGEIEAALCGYPGIRTAFVDASCDAQERKRIVAYIELIPGAEVDIHAVRRALCRTLPGHLVPAIIHRVDSIPQLPSGKTDRRLLRRWTESLANTTPAPSDFSTNENFLRKIWERVLGLPVPSSEADFYDLGGDSLGLMDVAAALRQAGRPVAPGLLMNHSVLRDLAAVVPDITLDSTEGEFPASREELGPCPLLPAQVRYLASNPPEPNSWVQVLESSGPEDLDGTTLAKGLAWMRRRHAALRTEFRFFDGEWSAHVLSSDEPRYQADPVVIVARGTEEHVSAFERARATIDIRTGSLLAGVIAPNGNGQKFTFLIHHLVIDAASWSLFMNEISFYCAGTRIRGRPPSYLAWARKRGKAFSTDPCSLHRCPENVATAREHEARVSRLQASRTDELLARCRMRGWSMEGLLLATFAIAVCRATTAARIPIDVEWHGRGTDGAAEGLIGNMVAIHALCIAADTDIAALIPEIMRSLGAARNGTVRGDEPLPTGRIAFNYLGLREAYRVLGGFRFESGRLHTLSVDGMGHALEVDALIVGHELVLRCAGDARFPPIVRDEILRQMEELLERVLHDSHTESGTRHPTRSLSGGAGSLIIGPTGRLGSAIVRSMLDREGGPLYCLHRDADNETLLHRITGGRPDALERARRRLIPVRGDLSERNLGLRAEIRREIVDRCTTFLHVGGVTSPLADPSEIDAVNIDGIQRVMDLMAYAQDSVLHYASTLSVGQHAEGGRFDESMLPSATDAVDIYVRSKIIAEHIVGTMTAAGRASIYRIGTIVPGPDDEFFPVGFLGFYMRLLIRRGIAPTLPRVAFPLAQRQDVAQSIVRLMDSRLGMGKTFHLYVEPVLTHTRLVETLRSLGHEIRAVSTNEFLETTGPHVWREIFGLSALADPCAPEPSVSEFSNGQTRKFLDTLGVITPELGVEHVRRLVITYSASERTLPLVRGRVAGGD